MDALSGFSSFITGNVQRRAEAMVAENVEKQLDAYIPDGYTVTDDLKSKIAMYIAKGTTAKYFPSDNAEQGTDGAEQEAARKKEAEANGGIWSLLDFDGDNDADEAAKEEKKSAEAFLRDLLTGRLNDKSEEAKEESLKVAVMVHGRKRAIFAVENPQQNNENNELKVILDVITNFFSK
eukprot:TRINITY_DN12751_c0_g1_i1.p1 TRINITY_DN12751_c0_g1~~TRINITY_DN12751_c0_g1_i1.p1  ORF type:complete len:179 (-),score=40.75 TRINITY_DN12751_c0_g1_i1:81-617(-)